MKIDDMRWNLARFIEEFWRENEAFKRFERFRPGIPVDLMIQQPRRFEKMQRFHACQANLWVSATNGDTLFLTCIRDGEGKFRGYKVFKSRQAWLLDRHVNQTADAYWEAYYAHEA